MIKKWRKIDGFGGMYRVSNFGEVMSLPHNTSKGGLLKGDNPQGYIRVDLSWEGKQKRVFVHRLVMDAFSPYNGNEKVEINHKDSDRQNNRLDNLEWVTHSYNTLHGYKYGFAIPTKGERNGMSRLETGEVLLIRFIKKVSQQISNTHLADMFGVSRRTVDRIISLKTWKI